jgi:hypothetical protein
MRTLILATCIILLTSFCSKTQTNCGADYDWTSISSLGMPNFQGNCYLVTNEQIRWAQLNGQFINTVLAPNDKQCPTKAQVITYAGTGNVQTSAEWNALASNACPAIGFFYPVFP